MKNNRKGFTLAELLIVVAIIAVLVAVAIPVFTAQLEKSREATDVANLRSAYGEAIAKYMDDPENATSAMYKVQQKDTGWAKADIADALPSELKDAANALKELTSGTFGVKVTSAGSGNVTIELVTNGSTTGSGTNP